MPCASAGAVKLPRKGLFCSCEGSRVKLENGPTTKRETSAGGCDEASYGVNMEETVQKSCWGVAARAVIGFVGLLALIYLFGGI